ncbi:hypothetical protein ACH5RR_015594 [Cinchona calisaya]|uniref:Uncharacterized protein n=1 Tax=Cinchona calisaya TaxID=153742 RepID=A0ABD2ZWQ6_9GENT
MSKTLYPVPVPLCSPCFDHVPENSSEFVPEPIPRIEPVLETLNEPKEKTDSAPKNVRFGKVYKLEDFVE